VPVTKRRPITPNDKLKRPRFALEHISSSWLVDK
jgi:hypothetical protein